jgi:hypothetical protein
MAKKAKASKKSEEPEKRASEFPAGTTLYCWRVNHPKFGWLGGHDDDHWEEKESTITDRMEYSLYPCELITKVTT